MSLEDFKQVARTFDRSIWDQGYGFEAFASNRQEGFRCLVVEAAYRKGRTAPYKSDRGIEFVAEQYGLPEHFVSLIYYQLGNLDVDYGNVESWLDGMAIKYGVQE